MIVNIQKKLFVITIAIILCTSCGKNRFSVTFSKALDNATIHILDAGGKVITQVKAKGYKVNFDLSTNAAGVYYVRIKQDGNIITKKVVKQ